MSKYRVLDPTEFPEAYFEAEKVIRHEKGYLVVFGLHNQSWILFSPEGRKMDVIEKPTEEIIQTRIDSWENSTGVMFSFAPYEERGHSIYKMDDLMKVDISVDDSVEVEARQLAGAHHFWLNLNGESFKVFKAVVV